jgi:hypothetical protein
MARETKIESCKKREEGRGGRRKKSTLKRTKGNRKETMQMKMDSAHANFKEPKIEIEDDPNTALSMEIIEEISAQKF